MIQMFAAQRRSGLALAIMLALGSAGSVHAADSRADDLEQRIAQLEQMVQSLKNELQEQKSAAAAPAAAAPAAAPKPAIVSASNPGTEFGYGGFIKADFMSTDYTDGELAPGSVGRDFYIPGAIPVGGTGNDAVYDAHAKQSRLWFTTQTVLDSGDKIGTRIEMDFAVPVGGDERQTNTYNPVVRHAFLTWNDWLFGQTWSNFMEVGALPETADFIGPTEGTVFVRQTQARYTNGAFAIALENPETTVMPFGGGARIVTDDLSVPDITARYTWKGDWGFVTLAGLVRELAIDNPGVDDSNFGGGVSLAGKFMVGEKDDLRFMLTGGSGVGRYIALNFGEDAVLDADGDIEALDMIGGYVAYRHVWSGTWRSNFMVSLLDIDNDSDLTGFNANQRAQSARVNLFYSPSPKLDLGVELSTAKRQLESESAGEMNRVHFMAKYSF